MTGERFIAEIKAGTLTMQDPRAREYMRRKYGAGALNADKKSA